MSGDGRGRPVRKLERSLAHSGGDPAARHLLLGPRGLSTRRLRLPGHRHAGANGVHSAARGAVASLRLCDLADRGRGNRHALRLGLSGRAAAALALPVAGAPRSAAAVAVAVLLRLCRCARRRLAGGGLGDTAVHRGRRAVSRSRSYPVRHLRRHRRHANRAGAAAARAGALARPERARRRRTATRTCGRACGASASSERGA